MKAFFLYLIALLHISKCRLEVLPCRTNCSLNGSIHDECWSQAIVYRSQELVNRLFSFSSLSVYVDSFRRYHPNEFNDTITFIDTMFENYLVNESKSAKVDVGLFTKAKHILLDLCRNLTLTEVPSVKSFPPLSCSPSTCASDIRNYMILFIITIAIACLTLIICIIQSIQTRRAPNLLVTAPSSDLIINSSSTVIPSTNTH